MPYALKCPGHNCTKRQDCYRYTREATDQHRHEWRQEANGDCQGFYPHYWNTPVRQAPPEKVTPKRKR